MFSFFERLVDPYADYIESDTPPTRIRPFLMQYARPFRRVFWAAAIMAVIVATIEVALISYMGRLVDVLAISSPEEVVQNYWPELLGMAAFILILRPLFQAVDVALLNNTILPNFGTIIRWRAHRHVLRQSVGWFENDFAGRIANRIMQTPPAAGEAVFQVFDAITYAVAYFIGATVLLLSADSRLILPMLIWLGFYSALVVWTIRRVGPASKAASDARSEVTGRVVDSYTNIHSVKLFANNDTEINYAKEAIENARKTFQREMRIFTIMDISLVALNGLLIVGVVGWAIVLWINASTSVGVVATAAALTLRLNAMTGWVMWAISSFFQNIGVVSEGMEAIAQPITLADKPGAKPIRLTEGAIKCQNLSHHYGRKAGGLTNIDLEIPAGQKVGLVGRSGAGKTTLVKLLLRFYDVDQGKILIDDQDISSVTQNSLRQVFGMVQQDSSLLHRSVRDNIVYGRPDASDGELLEAAKRAEAHDFILDLEDPEGRKGYDAQVGERGVKLSGGQRQRVALARVILKDAPILLLDEATSALDSEVEAAIQETLYGMMKGKTVVAIAHRLSTIAHMDRILVLEDGQIVEDGNHAQLLNNNGLYARFWNRQSGGFIGCNEAAE